MKLLIDADGCPVVDIALALAQKFSIECIIICDSSHEISRPASKTITVSKGTESVDFALVNLLKKGDLVITQDYGLAAMCLAKEALPINQDGMIYTDDNIYALLSQRHMAQKIRRSGGRLKGIGKRLPEQDRSFSLALEKILENTQTSDDHK